MNDEDEFESLYAQLQAEGLTDQQIESVLGILGLSEQFPLQSQDISFGEERIAAATPRGRRVGRVYRAAHPLEHLASGANRILGEVQRHRGRSRQEEILRDIMRRRRVGMGFPRGSSTPLQRNPRMWSPTGSMGSF